MALHLHTRMTLDSVGYEKTELRGGGIMGEELERELGVDMTKIISCV